MSMWRVINYARFDLSDVRIWSQNSLCFVWQLAMEAVALWQLREMTSIRPFGMHILHPDNDLHPDHSHSTRYTSNLVVPFPRVNTVKINYKYQFVKIWNNLPNEQIPNSLPLSPNRHGFRPNHSIVFAPIFCTHNSSKL